MIIKWIAVVLLVAIGIIYYPLNLIFVAVQKWYLPMKKNDTIIYYAFAPFYWILLFLTLIISNQYEKLLKFAH